MICPHCKNEHFDPGKCPACGLTETEAIHRLADVHFNQERYALAAENYGKLLHHSPGDIVLWKKQASAFAKLALQTEDPEELRKAEIILREALNHDWAWETGHQYRIQIADKGEWLDQLVREYRTISEGAAPERAAMAERMLNVVQLTLRFKSDPSMEGRLRGEPGWLQYLAAFWPLLFGLPLMVGAAQGAMGAYRESRPMGLFIAMLVAILFVTGVLLIFTIRRALGAKGGKKRKAS